MKVLIITLVTFIFVAVNQSLILYVPALTGFISWAPIILVFGLRYLNMYENLVVILITGIFIDALGAVFIGPTVIILLICYFILVNTELISSHSYWYDLFFSVLIISYGYNLLCLLFELIFAHNYFYFSFMSFIIGPVINIILSIIYFNILIKILSLFRLFDKNYWVKDSLGKL